MAYLGLSAHPLGGKVTLIDSPLRTLEGCFLKGKLGDVLPGKGTVGAGQGKQDISIKIIKAQHFLAHARLCGDLKQRKS